MLFLLACGRAPVGVVLTLRSWRDEGGQVVTTPLSGPSLRVTHPIRVDEAWAGVPARLELDATTWRANVDLDGTMLASGVGGNAPLWIEIPGGLVAGDHTLGVSIEAVRPDNVAFGRVIQEVGTWSFHPGHRRGADFSGRAVLRVGTAAEDVTTRAWLEDGAVHAELRGPAVAGRSASFTLVRDGAQVLALGKAEGDATGVAAVTAPWAGSAWPEQRATLVVQRDDGATWTAPFGARDADGGPALTVDGVTRYVAAVRADWSEDREDPRSSIFLQAVAAARRGAVALEWHGTLYSELAFDLADELGIGIVATPRCAGRRQRNGLGGVDPLRDKQLTTEHKRLAAALGRHAALWAWTTEWTGDFSAMSALDTAFFGKDDVVGLQAGQTGTLPAWIGEVMTDQVQGLPHPALTATIAAHNGAGIVLPAMPANVTGIQQLEEEAAERAALAEKGAVAWEAKERRGRALLEVLGQPGVIAWLEVPNEPAVGIVVGGDGVGRYEVDAAGPAIVRSEGGEVSITLEPGTWTEKGWKGPAQIVRLPAPKAAPPPEAEGKEGEGKKETPKANTAGSGGGAPASPPSQPGQQGANPGPTGPPSGGGAMPQPQPGGGP